MLLSCLCEYLGKMATFISWDSANNRRNYLAIQHAKYKSKCKTQNGHSIKIYMLFLSVNILSICFYSGVFVLTAP